MVKRTFSHASLMFQSLHQEVVDAVSDELPSPRFHQVASDANAIKSYSTYVMGRFKCNNNSCETDGWSSGKVTILIRAYSNNGYNAEVFKQRCRACKKLGRLELDEQSYVDRVAYRLKKWAGFFVEQPEYASKDGPPHMRHLCEGCKRGVCRQSSAQQAY